MANIRYIIRSSDNIVVDYRKNRNLKSGEYEFSHSHLLSLINDYGIYEYHIENNKLIKRDINSDLSYVEKIKKEKKENFLKQTMECAFLSDNDFDDIKKIYKDFEKEIDSKSFVSEIEELYDNYLELIT